MPSASTHSGIAGAGTAEAFFIGLISGTSVDGIDAALVSFAPTLRLVHAFTMPMADDLAADILRVSQADALVSLDFLGQLDTRVARAFAQAANLLVERSGVERASVFAVGSHGQTLRHQPRGDAPFSLQVGDGNVIAERCGITTVADFRRRDVAAGGQGAPLVPAFHAACFARPGADVAVLNLGGIANLTLLRAGGAVLGFDCGPGNLLMDLWCRRQRGAPYDAGGAWAAGGRVDEAALDRLLAEPFFDQAPPKSTGRDLFDAAWLDARLRGCAASPQDVMATLAELTARSAVDALRQHAPATGSLLVCGGGAFNLHLMQRLAALLAGRATVKSTAAAGVAPEQVEALAFAWLAKAHLARRPGNLPTATGARGPRVLGALYPAG